MSEISDELIMEFKEAFTLFDEDGDGYIKTEELGTLLRAIGQNPTEEELDTTMNELKISGSTDKIDFKQFLVLVATKFKTTNSEEELREAFKVFDRDGLGQISAWELRFILTEMGEKLTEEQVKQVIREAQVDHSGLINYENFISMMSSV